MSEQLTASIEGGSWELKVRREDGKSVAEVWSLGVKLSVTTLTAEGAVTVEDPAAAPTVYHFNSTGEAYNATQCRDDIRDGDVLVVESEGVTGFLDAAWPVAVTKAHGQFHGLMVAEDKADRFAVSIAGGRAQHSPRCQANTSVGSSPIR